jgi:hypothetical protein
MTLSKSSKSGWRVYADSTNSTVTLLPATELTNYYTSDAESESQRILDDKNPTTRRYPRTIEDAFPDSVERANWWYPPEARKLSVMELLMWTVGVSAWIGLAYFFAKN